MAAAQSAVTEHGDGDEKAEVLFREKSRYGVVLDPSLDPKKASRRERSQNRGEKMKPTKKEVERSLTMSRNHGRVSTGTERQKPRQKRWKWMAKRYRIRKVWEKAAWH